jgi:hypothetical protein
MAGAFENVGSVLPGIVANGDLTAAQYRAVTINNSGKAVLATANTAPIAGVLQNKPDTNEPCTIWGPGSVTKVVVGTGGATAGSLAMPAADGVTDATTGEIACGQFLQTGAAGEIVSMWMGPALGSTSA